MSMLPTISRMASLNKPVTVIIRIEGQNATIYEGSVTTSGHGVTTESGGIHWCDGTNGNEHPFPVPTCTAALDDAARLNAFTFNGPFNVEFDDFFITSIANNTNGNPAGWNWVVFLNSRLINVGGGQQKIQKGDVVLFAFTNAANPPVLKLKGPSTVVAVGTNVTVSVLNAVTRAPIAGATVRVVTGAGANQYTNANGNAVFNFAAAGPRTLKAEIAGGIRSEVLRLNVVL